MFDKFSLGLVRGISGHTTLLFRKYFKAANDMIAAGGPKLAILASESVKVLFDIHVRTER